MTSTLNGSTIPPPKVRIITLSHANYGRHFLLGNGINIPSSPMQRLHSFVALEGSPYRFIVVGQLMSFKVVEDSVRGPFFPFEKNTDLSSRYRESSSDIIFQSTWGNLDAHQPSRTCFLDSWSRYEI